MDKLPAEDKRYWDIVSAADTEVDADAIGLDELHKNLLFNKVVHRCLNRGMNPQIYETAVSRLAQRYWIDYDTVDYSITRAMEWELEAWQQAG